MGEPHSLTQFANDLAKANVQLVKELAQAEAERDEARTEVAQWEGSFKGMVAVERELRADLAKAVEGLRDIADGKFTRLGDTHASARAARSILAEIEEKGD